MSFVGRAPALLLALLITNTNLVAAQDSLAAGALPPSPPPDSIAEISRVPIAPYEVPAGPMVPWSRLSFNRDSIIWNSSITLADLLTAVPGVFVARGGFRGLPEYAVYAGRGAAAIEIYWDGHRLTPVGRDSIYIDPGEIPLTYLRRVEFEPTPSVLRVYLVSERQEEIEARSIVRFVTGDFGTGAYSGIFQKRWAQGLGFNVGVDFMTTDGASGPGRSDQLVDIWIKGEWNPDSTAGVSYQFRRHSVDSDPVQTLTGVTGVPARLGNRTDLLFSMFRSTESQGRGLRFDGGVWASSWTDDTLDLDQDVRSIFVGVRYSGRRFSAETRARFADMWIRNSFESRLNWSPVNSVVIGGYARRGSYTGERRSYRIEGTAGISGGPFSIVGTVSKARAIEAPSLVADTGQVVADFGVRVGMSTRRISGHVGLVRRDGYQPSSFPQLPVIASFDSSRQATYIEARAVLRPWSYLTIDAWYSDPGSATLDFQPPNHTRLQLTFRSKFWRTFRSGAFDLKAQISMDSWSRGTAGLSDAGLPIELRGITFYETYLEFQIVGFTIFWNMRNAYNAQEQYVPGLEYPRSAQTYGVRWEFSD